MRAIWTRAAVAVAAVGMLVSALVVGTGTPAAAATSQWGPVRPTNTNAIYGFGSISASGGSFRFVETYRQTDWNYHCGVLQGRWRGGPGNIAPLAGCGNIAGDDTVVLSGHPVPSIIQVRMCSTTSTFAVIASTCSPWTTIYRKPSARRGWGPIAAKHRKAVASGSTTVGGRRIVATVALRDRTRRASCGWVSWTAVKAGGGKVHKRTRACGGVTRDRLVFRRARSLWVSVCSGSRRHPARRTCSVSHRIR